MFWWCGLLVQCTGTEKEKVTKYFDLEGFIESQVQRLESDNPELIKTMKFKDDSESVTVYGADSINWTKELKLFLEHDINKPVLIDAYETKQDSSSTGEKVKSYHLIDNNQNGILGMEIVFNSQDHVTSWRSSFQEENILYNNYREMTLTADDNGKISGYTVSGYHRLIMNDTVHYYITAQLSY